MEDSQHLCPDCGADYVGAVVDDIASGAGADSRLMLASLEEGLAGLDAVPLPALGDTARKMLPALCAAALVFCLLAGVATGANIFYLLAAVALVPLAVSLLARMQGKLRLSAGEVVVRAAARVFAEDAASVRERFGGDAGVLARLDAMQLRLDDALARQASAHAQNRRKVTVIAAVVLICCSAGAGALAVCAAVVGLSVTACMVRPQVEDAPATAAPPATAETAEPTPTPAPTSVPAVAAAALPTLDNAANSPRFICPVKYKYISRFATNGHRGDDLCAAEGTEIYAAADGVVLAAQEHYSWGNFVEIDHGADANGLRWSTLYAHMQSCAVQVGQTVTAGQVIGYVGSTGNATGNACHFEMQVNGTLVEPRYFTAYGGSDAAELTQEKADEISAEAVRRAASDQVTAADGAALSGVDLFTLPVAPPPQVSGYDPENGHPGIDFAAEEGAEVYAVAGGIVTTADYDAEKGNYVVLDHGGGLETEYQHLKSSLVSAGQSVVQCQVLGYVGSTGNSTGPHLHFEARQDSAPADLTGTALLAE